MQSRRSKHIRLKEDLEKICLVDKPFIGDDEYRVDIPRNISSIGKDMQLSIMSDPVFKTMFQTESRKKYPCYLLSLVLNCSYEYLLDNMKYVKNNLDRDTVLSKGEECDFVCSVNNTLVNIEVNNSNTLRRNVEYLDRLGRYRVTRGGEYTYPDGLVQINLNNFTFGGIEDSIEIYKFQSEDGSQMIYKVSLQVFVPLIMKKLYNEGEKSLNEIERCVAIMATDKKSVAKRLAEGSEVMKEYVDEVYLVEEPDEGIYRAYNHWEEERKAYIEQEKNKARKEGKSEGMNAGLSEGIKKGEAKGRKEGMKKGEAKAKIELLRKMLLNGASVYEINALTDIPVEEIESIC